jgi:hypothetical protein
VIGYVERVQERIRPRSVALFERSLDLILLLDLDFFQFASAMRAVIRQMSALRLVNRGENRTATRVARGFQPPHHTSTTIWKPILD